MIIAFVIWSVVPLIFLLFGIRTWNACEPAGFFTGVKAPQVKDMKAYNHAVARLWFGVAIVMEIIGIPLLFMKQNSPVAIFLVLLLMFLIIFMAIIYLQIEKKYKKS